MVETNFPNHTINIQWNRNPRLHNLCIIREITVRFFTSDSIRNQTTELIKERYDDDDNCSIMTKYGRHTYHNTGHETYETEEINRILS